MYKRDKGLVGFYTIIGLVLVGIVLVFIVYSPIVLKALEVLTSFSKGL